MIGGPGKRSLKDEVEARITQYDIFRKFLGEFIVNVPFCNIIRGDSNPSAVVRESDNGVLVLKDYGDGRFDGDCYHLVMLLYKCNFHKALEEIASGFKLDEPGEFEKIRNWSQPDSRKKMKPPLFQVVCRKPTLEEIGYWNSHHLSLDDVKRENIFFPKSIHRNRRKLPESPYLTFCYWYEDVNSWKIYRPQGEVGANIPYHLRKWDSNLNFQYVENISSITHCKKAFIATSKKDRMVIYKATGIEHICSIQGENLAAIDDLAMKKIKENSKEQWVCGDSDTPGREFSWLLTTEFGFKHINPPNDLMYEGIKDFADWGRLKGLEAIKQHFLIKNII